MLLLVVFLTGSQLNFCTPVARYGREDLDVLGLTFRKDLFLVWSHILHSFLTKIGYQNIMQLAATFP